jgi:KaiC/GvpD/RAD55 family RecA-like ATPase
MVKVMKDKTKIKLIDLLKSHTEGLTITEIMQKTSLARHTILARLHNLIGEGKIHVRQINMAKLHYWKEHPPTEEDLEKSMKKGEKVQLVPISDKHVISKSFKLKDGKSPNNDESNNVLKKTPKGYKKNKGKDVEKSEIAKKETNVKKSGGIDIASIKAEIEEDLKKGNIGKKDAQILKQRKPIDDNIGDLTPLNKIHKGKEKHFIKTGIEGFDELLDNGIPEGNSIILAGGAGSGKTIFALQTLAFHASHGEKCLYMTFEESEEDLIEHMESFGWDPMKLIEKGDLKIQRFNPFDITRNVDALLAQQKGELLIEIDPIIIPKDFKPDFIVLDSLTAIASAFTNKDESYRIYIEQLFRFFEEIGATSFLITETEQVPKIFSTTGVEEFLAGGVVVLYNLKHGNVRENALEILKLRGAAHQKKIVAFQITGNGLVVYPEQEVFSEIE